jgi:uncharacterized protein (DUF2249 family)
MEVATRPAEPLPQLNRLFVQALRALGDAGQTDLACRLAAEGLAKIRFSHADEGEKLNGVLHYLTRPRPAGPAPTRSVELDVRELAPAQRHVVIFERCTRLPPGQALVLINDHDPKPLRYQFDAEFPGQFGWAYLESGPTVWRVQISRKEA